MNDKEQLQDLIIFFAELYKKPTLEFYGIIQNNHFERNLEKALNLHEESLQLTKPRSFEELKREYEKLFSPTKKQYVPLAESYYKRWTMDTTATVSFANQKGFFMGDAAWHMKYLLEQLNIEIADSSTVMPDHISVILELTAVFIEDEQKFCVFCQGHLDWLDDFIIEIKKQATNCSFYLEMTQLLQMLVSKIVMNKEDCVC